MNDTEFEVVQSKFPALRYAQARVWKEVVRGGSNKQIADTLLLSEDGVKSQLQVLFKKLDVGSREEAALKGLRSGVFTMRPIDSRNFPRRPTEREIEIASMFGSGLNRYQIAQELGVSPLTIKSHMARVAKGLGVSKQVRIVTALWRAGIIK